LRFFESFEIAFAAAVTPRDFILEALTSMFRARAFSYGVSGAAAFPEADLDCGCVGRGPEVSARTTSGHVGDAKETAPEARRLGGRQKKGAWESEGRARIARESTGEGAGLLTFAGMALGDGWGWLREVECDERKATGKAFVGIGAPKKNQSAGRADGSAPS
jgi:hypothetical protein